MDSVEQGVSQEQGGVPNSAPKNTLGAQSLPFQFKGDGMEYFKIWIVNILLTIVTLGIYSAWATVRNNRYFYSNLYLDEVNFRYLAEPLQILKGRIIAIIVFVLFAVLSSMYPIIGAILGIVFLFAMPFIVNQGLKFQRRMSSYKNIQFRFHGSYSEAFMAILVWPILGMLTLGVLYPFALLKMNQYVVKNSAYGTSRFDFSATYGQYGMIFLTAIGILLVIGVPIFLLMTFVPAISLLVPILYAVGYFGVIVYFMVSASNLFFNSTSLKEHTFTAQLTMGGLAKVILINSVLTVITLGLYFPAAQVRMAKYMADSVTFEASGSLDDFAAAEKEHVSALGDQLGEVFGV